MCIAGTGALVNQCWLTTAKAAKIKRISPMTQSHQIYRTQVRHLTSLLRSGKSQPPARGLKAPKLSYRKALRYLPYIAQV